jgi:hypothetical protein
MKNADKEEKREAFEGNVEIEIHKKCRRLEKLALLIEFGC